MGGPKKVWIGEGVLWNAYFKKITLVVGWRVDVGIRSNWRDTSLQASLVSRQVAGWLVLASHWQDGKNWLDQGGFFSQRRWLLLPSCSWGEEEKGINNFWVKQLGELGRSGKTTFGGKSRVLFWPCYLPPPHITFRDIRQLEIWDYVSGVFQGWWLEVGSHWYRDSTMAWRVDELTQGGCISKKRKCLVSPGGSHLEWSVWLRLRVLFFKIHGVFWPCVNGRSDLGRRGVSCTWWSAPRNLTEL